MFKIGDTVVVNVPWKNLLDGMSRYNGHTAVISGLPRVGWYNLDGASYLEFREDWLSSADEKMRPSIEEMWLKPADEEVSLHVPGAKDDADKPPVDLVFSSFPRALLELARVAGDGAEKYTRDGWVYVEDGEYRYANAAGRHTLKRWIEGEKDLDSGSWHLAHQAWNILAILELKLRKDERTSEAS